MISHPNATAQTIINTFKNINGILIKVLTELISCTSFAFIEASPPPLGPPKEGSDMDEELPQPIRARKRSSLRIAIALMRRTLTRGWLVEVVEKGG